MRNIEAQLADIALEDGFWRHSHFFCVNHAVIQKVMRLTVQQATCRIIARIMPALRPTETSRATIRRRLS